MLARLRPKRAAAEPTPQTRVLIAASQAISAAPDLGPLMATVLDQLDLVVPSASSAIHLLEGDKQRLVVFRSFPSAGPMMGSVWRRDEVLLTAEIAATLRPLVVNDVRAEPRWITLPSMEYICAWMGLPLLVQGELLGFLMLDRQKPHAFSPADVELASAFANQLALALRLARLAADNQRQLNEIAALYALSRTASASSDLGQLLPELAERLRAVVTADSCIVALIDEDGVLELASDGMVDRAALGRFVELEAAPYMGDIIMSRRPLVLANTSDYVGSSLVLRALEGSASVLGVPLLARGEVVGAVAFGCVQQAHCYTDEILRQAELAAGHAALSIINARLLVDAQRHARELTLRDEIRMAIAAAPPTVEALAHSVTSSLGHALGYCIVDCWEVSETQLVLLSSRGVNIGWLYLPRTDGICAAVANSGRARFVPDVQAEPSYLPPLDIKGRGDSRQQHDSVAPQIVSEVCVPVFDGARVAMVLNVEHNQRLRQSDLRLLTDIAAQVGLALEHVRLVGEIRRVQAERAHSARVSAIGTLAAGVAHEFNNILAALIGYAQLGLSGSHDEQIEALQVVEQVARRGKQITSGLLSFAEPGSTQLAPAQLGDLCDQALLHVEGELAERGIVIQRRYALEESVLVDPPKIVQALRQLLSNARDAMAAGGTLTIRTVPEDNWAVLSIIDTGTGIVPAVREHLFEPFVTTKGVLGGGSQGGVGLGLAISYGIVRRHGGTIEAHSVPGEGSTFTVRLPLGGSRHAADVEQPLRVLVVEDDDVVQALLQATLLRAGYAVSHAASVTAALKCLQQGDIDVLICDADLPGDDSGELVQHLLSRRVQVPVIVIGTRATQQSLEEWHNAPIVGVIQQPFQAEAVLATLDSVREELRVKD